MLKKRETKFRYVRGDLITNYITDVKYSSNPSENMLIKSNGVFTAVSKLNYK